ncbi:MAG: hypothetical protein AB7G17_09940 [Phycisphaerales bacterium]
MKLLRSNMEIESLEEMDFQLVAQQLPIDDAVKHFRPEECIYLWMDGPTIAESIGLAAERDIPPEVRGQFWFRDLHVWFGWHDLFEYAENEEGHLFARAFISIQFHGHSTPSDWNEYRRRVFEVPELKEAKALFETVTGPLEQCAFWDV